MLARAVLTCLALVLAPPVWGASSEEEHSLCWRGKPRPYCKGFILTDIGLQARLDDDPTGSVESPLHLSLDFGYAHNVSERAAVGGTAYIATGEQHFRVGVRGRYRRWLSKDVSVDLIPGLLVYGSEDNGYDYQEPGIIGSVTLGWRDWVGVTVEAEHSRYKFGSPGFNKPDITDTTWRVGGKLGSAPGLLGTAALLGLYIYFLATFED